jgi:hypothetical protein
MDLPTVGRKACVVGRRSRRRRRDFMIKGQ